MLYFTKLDQVAHLKGDDNVSEDCLACNGSGIYSTTGGHIFIRYDGEEGAWCFQCKGRGYSIKKVSSVRARIRSHAKKRAAEVERERKYEEAVAKRRAEEALTAKPLPTGRVEVTGEVVSVKEKLDRYGSSLKMLVKGDGWKVWGTVTKSLGRVSRGQRVEFTATIEESSDDPHFGFFKRPAKAEII